MNGRLNVTDLECLGQPFKATDNDKVGSYRAMILKGSDKCCILRHVVK
jgi:hypothetical protein